MALQHDAQGFLAGDPIDIGRAMAVWENIQKDVAAIKHALTTASSHQDNAGSGRPNAPVLPSGRDRTGSINGAAGAGQSPALPGIRAALNENRPARATARINRDGTPALPAGRDGNGRFTRRAPSIGDSEQNSAAPGAEGSAIRDLADRLTGSINGAAGGLDEADPAAKAFTEVAQPIARGYQMIAGNRDEKRKEGWYRRIFGELKIFRKEEGLFAKLASRRLKGIDERPDPESGDSGGMWATAIAAILGIGPAIKAALGFMLSKIPFIGKLFKGAAGGAGGVPPVGRLAAGMGKFLKRIPLLGALIGGVGAAADIYGSENDDTLTRREKDKNAGKATGGFAGSIGGMVVGAKLGAMIGALGGPIGVAIGGFVGGAAGMFFGDQAGQVIGDAMGGWVGDLRNADIPGRIASAWDATTGAIKSGWDGAMTGFKSVQEGISKGWNGFVDTAKAGWSIITGLFSAAYDGLKSLPVIGSAIKAMEEAAKKVAETARSVAAKVAKTAGEAKQVVTEKAKAVAGAAKDKAVEVGVKAAAAAKQGAEWVGDNTTAGKGVKAASNAASRAYDVAAAKAGSVLESVMPKGYRHKALFDGIKGGDSLTKNGSYTDEEAAKIRDLKNSGANTSANAKGGMSTETQDKISAQAKKAGLDPVMMQKMAAMESGGNPNAISSTGATGIYQFTGSTASGVGIKNRFDEDQNIEGGMKLANQNSAALKSAKLPVSAENLYMMHQLGPKAATEVIRGGAEGKLKSDMSASTQKSMNLNYGSKSKTAAEYIGTNKKALDDRYAAVTKDTGGVQTAIAKANIATAEQEKAYRKQKGREYKAQIAAVNDLNSYKPGGVYSGGRVALNSGPNMITAPAAPAIASVPAPAISVAPVAPAMAEAPPIVAPLASSGDSKKSGTTSYANPDASQDLKDRRIAHIVTGGFSA